MSIQLQNIRATEGARKVTREEGERFDVAGAHLTCSTRPTMNTQARPPAMHSAAVIAKGARKFPVHCKT